MPVDNTGSARYIQCIAEEEEKDMESKIQKWGNSLGLRIPKWIAEQVGVEAGSGVELSVKEGKIIVLPRRCKKYDLNGLLQAVTPDNLHGEIDTGEPIGREAW